MEEEEVGAGGEGWEWRLRAMKWSPGEIRPLEWATGCLGAAIAPLRGTWSCRGFPPAHRLHKTVVVVVVVVLLVVVVVLVVVVHESTAANHSITSFNSFKYRCQGGQVSASAICRQGRRVPSGAAQPHHVTATAHLHTRREGVGYTRRVVLCHGVMHDASPMT